MRRRGNGWALYAALPHWYEVVPSAHRNAEKWGMHLHGGRTGDCLDVGYMAASFVIGPVDGFLLVQYVPRTPHAGGPTTLGLARLDSFDNGLSCRALHEFFPRQDQCLLRFVEDWIKVVCDAYYWSTHGNFPYLNDAGTLLLSHSGADMPRWRNRADLDAPDQFFISPVKNDSWNIVLASSITELQYSKEKDALLHELSQTAGSPIEQLSQSKSLNFSAEDTYVGWGKGKIILRTSNIKLYTTELSSCIAILTRTDSHFGLFHFFTKDNEAFKEHLNQLRTTTDNQRIEVFLIGGNHFSIGNYNKILLAIEKYNKTGGNAEIPLQANKAKVQFGIAPSDRFYAQNPDEKQEVFYSSGVGISYAAFDEAGNPHAQLEFNAKGYNGDYNKLQLVRRVRMMWLH